ncbi:MAG: hypothetical protein ACFFEJ_16830 [Candidatus Thorarchaeota archaeon]
MKWNGISFSVNGNWIDFWIEVNWRRKAIIEYNGEPVVTEKLGLINSRRIFEFDIFEEGISVNYLIEMSPIGHSVGFEVFRDGEPIIVVRGDRKNLLKQATLGGEIKCYEVVSSEKTIEIPRGGMNMDSSSVYCLVHPNRRTIYLWKGKNAGFLMKLNGDSAAARLRGELGINYRIVRIEEGDEPSEFRGVFE